MTLAHSPEYAKRPSRNERGTNRETANFAGFDVLTRSGDDARNGGNLSQRPDGGVVTQRTANPLSLADFPDSLHFSPAEHGVPSYGGNVPSANSIRPFPTGVRYSWQNYHRPDPELAMIDRRRADREAIAQRLPGETLHAAKCRVQGLVDSGRNYSADNPRSARR